MKNTTLKTKEIFKNDEGIDDSTERKSTNLFATFNIL